MPRRTKGLGSLIKLKNSPFWQARFYDNMGRKISISTKTTVKQEAEAFLRNQMTDVRDKGLAPLSDVRRITYRDLRAGLLANYVERGNKSLRPRANGDETIPGLPQLDTYFGYSDDNPGPSIVQIGTDTGRAFVEQRQAEGVGNAVINRSLACLRRMLRIAHEDGKLPVVPIIRLLKEPPARKGFLMPERFEELLELLPKHLQPYIMFLYFCGSRSEGEAAHIEWPQVDLHHGLIRLEEDQTKNKEARIVPLPARLVLALAAIEPKEGRVFDTTNIRKEWQKACAACGEGRIIEREGKPYDPQYKGRTLHDLRRSAARNLLAAGVPETVIMKICGWKTRSVFIRYAIADTTDLTAAMQRWEDFAKNLPPQTVRYSLGKLDAKVAKAKKPKLLKAK
jgi:integrase